MYRHASVCLQGAVSSAQAFWQDGPGEESRVGCSGQLETVRDQQPGEIRLDLIARVRSEIAAGSYDTPEKWDTALDRLLERLDLT